MIPSTYTSAEHISLCQNEVVACPQKFEPGRQRIPHPRPLIVWKEGEEKGFMEFFGRPTYILH